MTNQASVNLLRPLRLPKFTFFDITASPGAVSSARALALSLSERDSELMFCEFSVPLRDTVRAFVLNNDPLSDFADTAKLPQDLFRTWDEEDETEQWQYQALYGLINDAMMSFFGPGLLGRVAARTWQSENDGAVFERFIYPDGFEEDIKEFIRLLEIDEKDYIIFEVDADTTVDDIERLLKESQA